MNSWSRRKGFNVFLFAFMVASLACIFPPPAATNPDTQAYLARAMQAPLTFTVPKAQSDEVWSRITSFMVRYLNGGPQGKITDSVAATASAYTGMYGEREVRESEYLANRIVKGDVVEFSIVGRPDLFNTYKKIIRQNVQIWALYARTGEIRSELIDKNF